MRAVAIWTTFLLVGTAVFAAGPSREERRLDPALKLLLRAQAPAGTEKNAVPSPISHQDAAEISRRLGASASSPSSLLLVVRFTGDERELAEAGFDVQTQIGNVFTGTIDADRLGDLANLAGVVFIEPSRP
ncbi:MAG: hypothetical protein ABIS20_24300, partial [Thermoanaerobaculia bacterium]